MKTKIFITCLAALALVACSPDEYSGADPNGVPQVNDYADAFKVTVDQSTNQAHFTFDPSVQGITPVWIINGSRYSSSYSDSAYYRKAGDYTVECKVKNRNGISDGSIIQTFHVNKTKMNGFAGFVADSKYNMWRQEEASAHKPNTFFYAPGWSQIADPNYGMDGYDYENITLPKATSEQWQAQMHLPSNISLSAANNYDFSVILTSNTDHNGVTIKVTDVSDDDNFLFTEKTTLKAGEPVCFWKSDLKGIDASQIKIVFDFGGNADNTTINVENIVLKDHANDDGTKVPEVVEDPTVYTYNSPNNIWKQIDDSFDSKMMSFYYANGDSWAANPDPIGFKALGGGKYEVTLPDASSQQWQAQVFFHTDLLGTLLPVKAGENYDMRVKVHATADIPGMTFKVTSADDDKVFFTADRHDITADTDTEIKIPAKSLSADASTVNVVFDFGGAPAGTVVTISDITIQKTAK